MADIITIDPITMIILLVVLAVVGYMVLRAWRSMNKQSAMSEKRGLMKQLFDFNRLPTVPTIRIVPLGNGLVALQQGKRAKLRENSLTDSMDKKGWDIQSSPIPFIDGNLIELGYITHPAGCTLDLKVSMKIIKADNDGNPVYEMAPSIDNTGKPILDAEGDPVLIQKPQYIEGNYEGVIGVGSDLDDFNQSTEREISRGWIVPLLVGIIAGVVFFAPLFAWGMSMIAGAGK